MRMLPVTIALLCSPWAFAAEPPLSVAFGEADISPVLEAKKPVYLAGFGHNRIATKIHDPVLARVVVLSDGTKKIALVSVDLVGYFLPEVEWIRSELKGFEYVLVSSTHNHEGPDALGLWGASPFESGVDPTYLKTIRETIVRAVLGAEKKLAPAVAKIGAAKDPELLNDSRLPSVKHEELVAIRFETPDAKPLGILVQWNCHPESMGSKNTEITSDFVGYTAGYLKKKYECPVAYFTGTVGGLMANHRKPLKNDQGEELKENTFARTEKLGIEIGELADKALVSAVPAALTPFEVRTRAVLIPVENALYKVAGAAGVFKRTLYLWEGESTPKVFRELKDIKLPTALKTEVGYLQLGELGAALIPGEIYPELVLDKIQEPVDPGADYPEAPKEPAIYPAMKTKYKLIFGLANDEIGYIIPKRQWDEKKPFCYKLKEAQYGEINSCGPDVAKGICEAFKGLMKKE